jgi:hypothetical protein
MMDHRELVRYPFPRRAGGAAACGRPTRVRHPWSRDLCRPGPGASPYGARRAASVTGPPRKRRTAARLSSGFSPNIVWPAPSMITSSASR